MEKPCSICSIVKPEAEYYFRNDTQKLSADCKECRRKRSSRQYHADKPKHKRLNSAWFRSRGRFMRYGLTPEQYNDALEKQGNCCALCQAKTPGGKGVWHIDHTHTGRNTRDFFRISEAEDFRGLLCHSCNISLGHYEKLLARVGLQKVLDYIARA